MKLLLFILNLIKKMFKKKDKKPTYYYDQDFIVGYSNMSDD
tara:strand:- start:3056 stop:3178 length:123 start_codon:yes stop_codon:yes gene_type:complete